MSRYKTRDKNKKNLYLGTSICEQVDYLLTKPGETKPPHGAWSDLVETLLYDYWRALPLVQREAIMKQLALRKAKEQSEVLKLIEGN